MIPCIDFKIFGNGRGLAQPYFPGKFYWLIDRKTQKGTFYHFIGGFGAQLESFQWTHPKPGEWRDIHGHMFYPFLSRRRWFRVRVSWARMRNFKDAEEIRQLEQELGNTLRR